MIWYDMIWYEMIWYEMIWYDMIWYDMIWLYIIDSWLSLWILIPFAYNVDSKVIASYKFNHHQRCDVLSTKALHDLRQSGPLPCHEVWHEAERLAAEWQKVWGHVLWQLAWGVRIFMWLSHEDETTILSLKSSGELILDDGHRFCDARRVVGWWRWWWWWLSDSHPDFLLGGWSYFSWSEREPSKLSIKHLQTNQIMVCHGLHSKWFHAGFSVPDLLKRRVFKLHRSMCYSLDSDAMQLLDTERLCQVLASFWYRICRMWLLHSIDRFSWLFHDLFMTFPQ